MPDTEIFLGIRILTPGSGKCPVCAGDHDPMDPHDIRSLYYLAKFHSRHGRFPTEADAMAHCSMMRKLAWLEGKKDDRRVD